MDHPDHNLTAGRRRTRAALDIATGLLLLLTASGYLARWLWPAELVCHFRAHYLVLAGFVAVLQARLGRRWPARLAGLVTLVNLLAVAPLYVPRPSSAAGPTIRLLAANVHLHNPDPEAILALIEAEAPDLVVIVELPERWDAFRATMATRYPTGEAFVAPDSRGLGLWSRWPGEVTLAPVGERPALVGRFTVAGRRLTVLGAHPLAPARRSWWRGRNAQYRRLAAWCAGEPGLLIVAGDLNATSFSPVFGELLRAGRLVDSRRGRGLQPSWPVAAGPLGLTLDHVLHRPELGVTARRLLPDVGSDHRPVLVELVLP